MKTPSNQTGKKHNSLIGRQKFEFHKWLDGNREFAANNIATVVAAKAQEALGFTVTFSNVNYARRELEITTRRRLNLGGSSKDRNAALAHYVCDLYADLGKPIPSGLLALKNKGSLAADQ